MRGNGLAGEMEHGVKAGDEGGVQGRGGVPRDGRGLGLSLLADQRDDLIAESAAAGGEGGADKAGGTAEKDAHDGMVQAGKAAEAR